MAVLDINIYVLAFKIRHRQLRENHHGGAKGYLVVSFLIRLLLTFGTDRQDDLPVGENVAA